MRVYWEATPTRAGDWVRVAVVSAYRRWDSGWRAITPDTLCSTLRQLVLEVAEARWHLAAEQAGTA